MGTTWMSYPRSAQKHVGKRRSMYVYMYVCVCIYIYMYIGVYYGHHVHVVHTQRAHIKPRTQSKQKRKTPAKTYFSRNARASGKPLVKNLMHPAMDQLACDSPGCTRAVRRIAGLITRSCEHASTTYFPVSDVPLRDVTSPAWLRDVTSPVWLRDVTSPAWLRGVAYASSLQGVSTCLRPSSPYIRLLVGGVCDTFLSLSAPSTWSDSALWLPFGPACTASLPGGSLSGVPGPAGNGLPGFVFSGRVG